MNAQGQQHQTLQGTSALLTSHHFVQCHVRSAECEVKAGCRATPAAIRIRFAQRERDLLLRAGSAESNTDELVCADPRAGKDARLASGAQAWRVRGGVGLPCDGRGAPSRIYRATDLIQPRPPHRGHSLSRRP
jgi:hypothetical protein